MSENEFIARLAQEKDQLIQSLILTNKSAVTGALSASIAHELNQPLGASLINIQFLRMLHEGGRLTQELTGQLINQLEGDIKRAGVIIKSLQSIFVKNSDGYEYINPAEVIESALAIYRHDLIAKGISIEADIATDVKVYLHKGQLLQVLLNLMNNAIQALSESEIGNKFIDISCRECEGLCVISVADSGPGIDEARQAQLFELLKSSKLNGMGLGLWLCAQIAHNFGGKITYTQSQRGGAQFTLSLPIGTPEEKGFAGA